MARIAQDEMAALYSEEEESAAPAEEAVEDTAESEVQPHSELVSTKLLGAGPLKKGDKIIIEVVALHGDEAEVKYATAEEAEAETGEMDEDAQLAALAE